MNGIWGIPAALAVVTFVGLASAIFGDGLWDAACWIGLAIPLAVCAIKLWKQRPQRIRT